LAAVAARPHHGFPLTGGGWVLEHIQDHFASTEGFHSWMHAHGISTLAKARELMDVNLSGWDGATVLGGFLVYDDPARDVFFRRAPSEGEMVGRLRHMFEQLITWPG